MTHPDWLDGSYEDALRLVAERALYSRAVGGLVKNADPAGTLGGAWDSVKATAGGLFGAGDDPATSRQKADAVRSIHGARQELGVLGADEGKVDAAARGLAAGTTSGGGARRAITGSVPGAWSQFRNVPQAISTALGQGRPADAAAQADVAGLKNALPFSGHFSPLAAAAAGGAHALARRGLPATLPAWGGLGSKLQSWRDKGMLADLGGSGGNLLAGDAAKATLADHKGTFNQLRGDTSLWGAMKGDEQAAVRTAYRDHRHAERAKSLPGRAGLGGWGPLLAGLGPLAAREWLGGGYRSGGRPADDIVSANHVLNHR